MAKIALLGALAMMAGCAAPHAVSVRCDAHLTPINAPGAHAASDARSAAGEPRGSVTRGSPARAAESAGR